MDEDLQPIEGGRRLLTRAVARPQSDASDEIGRVLIAAVKELTDRCPEGCYVHHLTIKREAQRGERPRGRRYYLTAVFERGADPRTGRKTP